MAIDYVSPGRCLEVLPAAWPAIVSSYSDRMEGGKEFPDVREAEAHDLLRAKRVPREWAMRELNPRLFGVSEA
jgi:hypothetical protein